MVSIPLLRTVHCGILLWNGLEQVGVKLCMFGRNCVFNFSHHKIAGKQTELLVNATKCESYSRGQVFLEQFS